LADAARNLRRHYDIQRYSGSFHLRRDASSSCGVVIEVGGEILAPSYLFLCAGADSIDYLDRLSLAHPFKRTEAAFLCVKGTYIRCPLYIDLSSGMTVVQHSTQLSSEISPDCTNPFEKLPTRFLLSGTDLFEYDVTRAMTTVDLTGSDESWVYRHPELPAFGAAMCPQEALGSYVATQLIDAVLPECSLQYRGSGRERGTQPAVLDIQMGRMR
jgi:hypothetical protein